MEQASKFANAFQSDALIEISLADGGHFTVQRALLCDASEYFRSALLGGFAEARDKTLRLPGCDTKVFELLLYWICKHSLPDVTQMRIISDEDDESEHRCDVTCHGHLCDDPCYEQQAILARLWHAAGMYLLPDLQNAAMNCLLDMLVHCFLGQLAMETAFEMGSSNCIFRKVLLEEFVHEFFEYPDRYTFGNIMNDFSSIPDFFAAFAVMMRQDTQDGKNRSTWGSATTKKALRLSCMVPIVPQTLR